MALCFACPKLPISWYDRVTLLRLQACSLPCQNTVTYTEVFENMLQRRREGATFRRLILEKTVDQIRVGDDWVTFRGAMFLALKHGFKIAFRIYNALQMRMCVACQRKHNLWSNDAQLRQYLEYGLCYICLPALLHRTASLDTMQKRLALNHRGQHVVQEFLQYFQASNVGLGQMFFSEIRVLPGDRAFLYVMTYHPDLFDDLHSTL